MKCLTASDVLRVATVLVCDGILVEEKNADQLFKDEQDCSPPGKVQLLGGYNKNAI